MSMSSAMVVKVQIQFFQRKIISSFSDVRNVVLADRLLQSRLVCSPCRPSKGWNIICVFLFPLGCLPVPVLNSNNWCFSNFLVLKYRGYSMKCLLWICKKGFNVYSAIKCLKIVVVCWPINW